MQRNVASSRQSSEFIGKGGFTDKRKPVNNPWDKNLNTPTDTIPSINNNLPY